MKEKLADLIFFSIRESRSIEELAERLVDRGVQIVPEGAKMSRDKQIEEMARDIGWSRCTDCLAVDSCLECSANVPNVCFFKEIAEDLCNKGYRKVPEGAVILTRAELDALNKYQERFKGQDAEAVIATEVAREIFAEIENANEECIHIDTSINIGYFLQTKFEHKLAELKKKYTVTDTNVGCKESEEENGN